MEGSKRTGSEITDSTQPKKVYDQNEKIKISSQQGSSYISLEGQSAAEFSYNPDQTHLPVIF